MMRSPHFFAVAVRAPNGEIVLHHEPHEKTWINRQKWIKWPFFRGAVGLIDGLVLGTKSLRFAANVQVDPQYQKEEEGAAAPNEGKGGSEPKLGNKVVKGGDTFSNMAVMAAMIGGLGLGLFLFNYLPNALAIQAKELGVQNPIMINFITEIIKVVFFLGYLLGIAQLPDIKEIFKYHGAEHMAINVIEDGEELSIENVRKKTRLHPRCGTSFAIIVLILGMILFTFFPKPEILNNKILTSLARFLIEIPFLPIISGVAYELIRYAGKMRNSSFVRALFWPGLMTQYITTAVPREDQIEVAMVSLQTVLDLEKERAATLETAAPAIA